MNERNVSERIVRAVDARLSGLTGDLWMARRVLARSKASPDKTALSGSLAG